ncbi:MAG: hypothetical protein INR70_29870, partial [Parafilimonas terrae]|nr:hypothetical protein [Parafilimonas terrae]
MTVSSFLTRLAAASLAFLALIVPARAAQPPCPVPPPMPNYLGDKPHTESAGAATFKFVPPEGGPPQDKRVSGALCRVTYRLAPGKPAATDTEIQRFYRDALGRLGASLPYRDERTTVAHFTAGGPEAWVSVADTGEAIDITAVQVVKPDDTRGEPATVAEGTAPRTAAAIRAALDRDGRASLHFHFDPGKALLKPADAPLVGEILKLLAGNRNLILQVEGHAAET